MVAEKRYIPVSSMGRGPKTGFGRRTEKKGRQGHKKKGEGWMAGVEAKNAPADPPPAAAAPPRRRRMSGPSGVCRPREPLVLSTAPKAVAARKWQRGYLRLGGSFNEY